MQTKVEGSGIEVENLVDPSHDKKSISIPLTFDFIPVELLSKQFTKLNHTHPFRIHYLGPRPHNTLTIHKKYAHNQKNPLDAAHQLQARPPLNRYSVDQRKIVESYFVQERLRGNSFYKNNLFYRAFEGMNPTLNLQDEFTFNSVFEGGNLDCVIKVKERQFDLFLRVDSNTKGHVHWFYFSVSNHRHTGNVRLNLCNLSKAKNLYQNGMQPYVFSKLKYQNKGEDWKQQGVNLGLTRKELRYQYLEEKVPNLSYFCLQFQYCFEEPDDEVFFAYCVPYTYSQLLRDLEGLNSTYTRQTVLGKSLAGVDIPLLQITNHQQSKEKKNVLITARFHPGESNSSHTVLGFMHFLISNHKQAVELRNRLNFFIVPMANPDGVILGNARTSAAGKDLNRQFLIGNREMHPQVALIKDLAKRLHLKHGIFMYLDFHGHSKKKNTFFYGPAYSISEPNYYKCRILPKIIQKVNSNFRYHSCSFFIDEQKKQTARGIMFELLKIPFTFTIETSIGFFYNCQRLITQQFNQKEWNIIGGSIAEGLAGFLVGYQQFEELLKERRAMRQRKRPPTAGKSIFQEEEQVPVYRPPQPLKIAYKEKTLFGNMIEQIKSIKNQGYMKEIDDDCDSDPHDENEDFDKSKMKEFNSLLNGVGSSGKQSKKEQRPKQLTAQKVRSEVEDSLTDERDLMCELDMIKKPSTVHVDRPKPAQKPNKRIPLRDSTRNPTVKVETRRAILYRTAINSPSSNRSPAPPHRRELKKEAGIEREKKANSEGEFGSRSDKINGYFGEYQIFFENEKVPDSRGNNIRKYSLSRKERSKASRRPDESKFMSESFLEPSSQKIFSGTSMQYPEYQSSLPTRQAPKPANYQFRFDEIDSAMVAKDKLKDYLKSKASRAQRSNAIGPASFYGIRQNLNNKISHKKRFFDDEGGSKGKQDSIKIIKFV